MSRLNILYIIIIGAILRLSLLIAGIEFIVLPNGGSDALNFEDQAWLLSEFGREDISTYLTNGSGFLALLGSYVYDVFGRSPYALGLIMVSLGTATIYIAYLATLALWSNVRSARAVALAVALFPQLAIHSALFLRETPVAFCLAIAGLYAIRFAKNNQISAVLNYVIWVSLGALFHTAVLVAMPALLLGMILARPKARRGNIRFYLVNLVAVSILGGVVLAANSTGYGLGKFGGALEDTMETFETREMRDVQGGAAFPEWMRIRGGVSDMWKIPVRLITFTFAPLIPFLVRNAGHLPGLLDAALYAYLFWLAYKYRNLVKQNRPAIVLLVIVFILLLAYSMGVSNFGTAIRHRAKIAVLLIILSAGLPQLQKRISPTYRTKKYPEYPNDPTLSAKPIPLGFFSRK